MVEFSAKSDSRSRGSPKGFISMGSSGGGSSEELDMDMAE